MININITVSEIDNKHDIQVVDTSVVEIPLVGKLRKIDYSVLNNTTINQIQTAVNKILTEFNKID